MNSIKKRRFFGWLLSLTVFILLISPVALAAQTQTESKLSPEDFNGKTIGILTGSIYAQLVSEKIENPVLSYYPSLTDAALACEQGKVDAYVLDLPVADIMLESYTSHTIAGVLDTLPYGFIFKKGDEKGEKLCREFNAFLADAKENGLLDKLTDIWITSRTGSDKDIDYEAIESNENGVLEMAICTNGNAPFICIQNEKYTGYEVHLAVEFCKAYGYGLNITDMAFGSLLNSVQSGIADMSASTIAITAERQESMLFSDPDYNTPIVLVTKDTSAVEHTGFFTSLKNSIYKTFISENRWKLFATGVLNTMLITVFSILFGTLFGFSVFMLCRNQNKIANAVANFCFSVIHGLPVVVLLMILYYIVFAKSGIGSAAVSVVAFSLTFGCSVFGMLKTGVGAVDNGQYEAAFALGFKKNAAFLQVILPQAAVIILPLYRSEVVSLIKATAVVGYIAVQDLTRQSDIVRSLTYDAFFPLIASAVIYFILESLLIFLVKRIEKAVDKRHRKPGKILKGVKTK